MSLFICVCIQLNGFKYHHLTFTNSIYQVFLSNTNNLDEPVWFQIINNNDNP